jgi:DegV family protein with EDD domain
MIGICTDSNAQLPAALAADLGIEVVPLTVTVDGTDYLEGIDLDADAFYRLCAGRQPAITTAAPSPSQVLDAYRQLAARGADAVVSVHIGSAVSGTLNAAHVAAAQSDVPVRLVDTGAASFVVAVGAIEAAKTAGRGASVAETAAAAERAAAACGNVFFVGGLDFLRAGGRLDPTLGPTPASISILSLRAGAVTEIATAADIGEAVTLMAGAVLDCGTGVQAAVGTSDPSTFAIGDQLEQQRAAGGVDVIRYRVLPSVGAHTGPGTAGIVFWPGR